MTPSEKEEARVNLELPSPLRVLSKLIALLKGVKDLAFFVVVVRSLDGK